MPAKHHFLKIILNNVISDVCRCREGTVWYVAKEWDVYNSPDDMQERLRHLDPKKNSEVFKILSLNQNIQYELLYNTIVFVDIC